jgi:hypothetical protein
VLYTLLYTLLYTVLYTLLYTLLRLTLRHLFLSTNCNNMFFYDSKKTRLLERGRSCGMLGHVDLQAY